MFSIRSRPRTLAATLAVSTLALTAGAEAASAAPFDFTTNAAITSGRAHAVGSITFPSARSVDVSATIDDLCSAAGKGDGYAAYLRFAVHLAGGHGSMTTYRDDAGCTSGARSVSFRRTFSRDIRYVRVNVFEGRAVPGGIRLADRMYKVFER